MARARPSAVSGRVLSGAATLALALLGAAPAPPQIAPAPPRAALTSSSLAGSTPPLGRLLPRRVPSRVEPSRLAVLPVLVGTREDLNVNQAFAGVEQASAFRPLRPMSLDDYFFQDGRELSGRALACGGDTGCLATELAVFRADLGLVIIGNAEIDPPLLGLVLIDTARRVVLGEGYEILGPAPLSEQVATRVDALLEEAGIARSGQLELVVEPASATIEVAGGHPPDKGAAFRFTLPPGEHPVRVSAPEHGSVERRVAVAPGEVTRLDIRLEREGSVWSSPWLWAGVAAVAIGAGATAGVLAAEGGRDCLCVIAAGDGRCIACP